MAYNSRGVNAKLTTPLPHNGADLEDLDIALNFVN